MPVWKSVADQRAQFKNPIGGFLVPLQAADSAAVTRSGSPMPDFLVGLPRRDRLRFTSHGAGDADGARPITGSEVRSF